MKLNSIEDVFVKINCMISNTIQKLQQEATAQLKDWCDKERQLLGSGQLNGSGCVMKLNSVENVFAKIKCMIGNMIQKLQQEAATNRGNLANLTNL